jgi:DUF438 domain-containing protein
MPGKLPENTVISILGALPLDITYIDGRDIIRYYSDYRIFKRTPDILGTPVQDCHSPSSRDNVNGVIDDLRSGRKDMAEFMVEKSGRRVRVRYIAVRDEKDTYTGLVETAEWAD